MVHSLPTVMIGGPPQAGKSVLFYALTHALHERGIAHHAIRACPDGEGNWSQEGDKETVSNIRKPIKGAWPSEFVQRISQDLAHRCLPFLVDLGGRPTKSDAPIFRQCTHSVLLLRADEVESTRTWRRIVSEYNLAPVAEIFSQLEGESIITSQSPILEGTISGLKRYYRQAATGKAFDALVDRIATLFDSYASRDVAMAFCERSPTRLLVNLPDSLRTFTYTSNFWELEMLIPFLNTVPQQTPLSVYGKGPNWLYAALAAHAGQQPFYQFDPRLPFGWLQPIRVQLGNKQLPEMAVKLDTYQDATVLSIAFPARHLDYFQPDPLPVPPVPTDRGLIIDGPIPHWLLTALVRFYKESGTSWIAPHYVQEKKAVVAYSHVETYPLGTAIPLPVH